MKLLHTLIAAALLVSATASQAIDLLLHANTRAQIITGLNTLGLVTTSTDPITGQVIDAPASGVDFTPWAGSGKLMTAKAVPDPQNPLGPPLTPASFLAGYVMEVRISGALAISDTIANPVDGEQTSRSKIVKAFKTNGTPGTFSLAGCTVNFYKVGNVEAARFGDVTACLTAAGLPGHEWAGGNTP